MKPGRGVDGLCEPIGIPAGVTDWRRQEGIRYPAWDQARFNPSDSRQVAALRSELDSAGFLHRHLYVLHLATKRRKLLVRDVGCGLSWSRTGWLVLERAGQLWKIKANGDSLTSLTDRAAASSQPVWSPTGRLLACWQAKTDGSAAPDLVLLSPAGRLVKRLALGNVSAMGTPTWAPDGRRLAFRGADGPRDYLYEYDMQTSRIRVLFELTGRRYGWHSLHWLKNGQEIVWRAPDRGLTIINLATRRQRVVWAWQGVVYPLSLDVDATGRRILVVSAEGRLVNPRNANEGAYMETEVFTANLNGSDRMLVK